MGRTTFGLDWAESYLLQEDARPYQLIQRKEGSSIAGDICEAVPLPYWTYFVKRQRLPWMNQSYMLV